MKKLFLYLVLICLVLTGCGKKDEDTILNEFKNKVESSNSYYLEGNMELTNNEDIYTYNITVSYQKDDNYKIELTNAINNHKQVILRNADGVYIVTPSLNKSFKFQSDWPYNNSQVYLLSSLLDDISNDSERTFQKEDDNYIFTSTVNYPNNEAIVKQKVYFNSDALPSKVEVINDNDNIEIKMVFNKIDLNSKFNDDYFKIDSILENNTKEETKETATIDDIIYPMYLPVNTYLTNEEKVSTEDGERLILTFSGDSSFTLVEETASYSETPEIISTYGDAELIGSSIAVINENSANWFQDGIEYYIVSDTMSNSEMMQVIKSISVLPVSK